MNHNCDWQSMPSAPKRVATSRMPEVGAEVRTTDAYAKEFSCVSDSEFAPFVGKVEKVNNPLVYVKTDQGESITVHIHWLDGGGA